MDFEVHWGVEDSEREPVANLLYDSLGEKFIPVLGTRTKGVLCVANALVSERTIVAKANHKVLGIAGLEFEKLGFLNMSLRYLLKCLGRGILRAIFNGWILEQTVPADEMYLDAIAVTEQARGIGRQLIDSIKEAAIDRNFTSLKLSVVDTNTRAIELYKRIGFKELKLQKIPYPWSKTFGFSAALEMELEL